MRVADYIFKTLADYGVKHVFLVTGGGAMFLNDALGREKRITPVCNHNESGSAIAAEGYARTTGDLAVVSVTTGPGGTNAMTGLIGAWLDSQPVLFISGQVKLATSLVSQAGLPLRQLGDQEINIIDMVKPVTKYSAMVTDARSIVRELGKAVHIATHGRKGPVWLDIPINVQSAEIEPERLEKFVPDPAPPSDLPRLDYVAESFAGAKAPVIVAGQGVRLAGARQEFLHLAEKMNIPVLATFGAFDLMPTDNAKMIGRIGTIGTRAGNIALQNADWILSIGSRNNIRQVSYNFENFAARAKDFICVDIDRAELDKSTIRPTLKIQADAGDFIRALARCLENWPGSSAHAAYLKWCQERKKRYPVVLDTYRRAAEGINPYVFTEILTGLLPESAIVACTNATPSLALFQGGIVKAGQRMFCNSGCAAMGFGLPAALGAAAAAQGSGRPVICLEGDGSLMMNIQEMQTAATHRMSVKMFLYDNNEYCSIRQTHDNFFGRRTGCDAGSGVTFPEWSKVADAFAWRYFCIDSEESAGRLIPEILAAEGPVFCDVKLVPGYTFAPKLSSRRLPDGTLVSPSLEDMFPFLSREEMQDNIYMKGDGCGE
ncbi:MAG: thiamine pyrophosphate-binding protein [Lentisphaeria bacterium]|nr:thiamine pyrophosphate-binding protein [Lentisphaeria bacterium]